MTENEIAQLTELMMRIANALENIEVNLRLSRAGQ